MRKNKILIVEDEDDIRDLIHFHLYKHNYEIFEATNGLDAEQIAINKQPDLIILDIMIPQLNGLELCKKLKQNPKTKEIKIIFLSAKSEEEDIVKGLELGAEDYLTKPFSPKILLVKIKNILHRGIDSPSIAHITLQGVELNDKKRKVYIDKVEVNFTVSEFHILKLLITSPGHVYTRAQIVNNIRGHNHAVTDRSIDTQLVSIRKKMGIKGKLIETVWGVGYRFKDNEV